MCVEQVLLRTRFKHLSSFPGAFPAGTAIDKARGLENNPDETFLPFQLVFFQSILLPGGFQNTLTSELWGTDSQNGFESVRFPNMLALTVVRASKRFG